VDVTRNRSKTALVIIDHRSTVSRGSVEPTFSSGGQRILFLYCHYHAPSMPFTPSITHTL